MIPAPFILPTPSRSAPLGGVLVCRILGLSPAPKKASARGNFRGPGQCAGRELNPHALTGTWPSTTPVCQFQHQRTVHGVL